MSNGQPQFWGATPLSDTDWSFAVWSPDATVAHVILDGHQMPMDKAADGTFRLTLRAAAGMAYRFSIDGQTVPDPAARQQQETVHGPSLLTRMLASDDRWTGRDWRDSVITEVHIGTFTTEGTFAAAASRLADLAALGINTVEVMPIAQFAGAHGWGYDGVLPYAPHPSYGMPDDFAKFVRVAHDLCSATIKMRIQRQSG